MDLAKNETIEAVSATLRDRIKRLDIDIQIIEENAKIYATSAEDLAKFTRDAKIAEAYCIPFLLNNKSQSLAAGFQPETFKVSEFATPPLSPSSPKRNLVIALGIVLGLLTGCAFSIINFMRRGVFYTKTTLVAEVSPKLTLNSKPIKGISRKPIDKIQSIMSTSKLSDISEAQVKLANKKLIYVLNSGGKVTASDCIKLLAAQSSTSGKDVVVCDQTGKLEKGIVETSQQHPSGLPIASLINNVHAMMGSNNASLFTMANFNLTIKELLANLTNFYLP